MSIVKHQRIIKYNKTPVFPFIELSIIDTFLVSRVVVLTGWVVVV